MPSVRPTVSTEISWLAPTGSSCEVSGANGSVRLPLALPASPSGAMVAVRLQRTPGKVAIDETLVVSRRLGLRQFENLLVQRRQRAGRIGIAGIAGQGEGLAAAAAEVDFLELAAFKRLRHPAGAAIAVEGFGVLPDPGDRVIAAHRFEFEPGNGFGGVAGQDLAGRRNVEELPAPAAHAFFR